jgi:hypothetical protein
VGSACYVYAIVGRGTPLPSRDMNGVRAELSMVSCRELAAVTETRGDDLGRVTTSSSTTDAVLHHEAVVEAVRRQGAALPVRFGTVFRSTTAVVSAIEAQYEPLTADLGRLGDKVEVGLTALWAEDALMCEPPENALSLQESAGARYLRARAAEFQRDDALKERARAVSRELDHVLGAMAIERRVSLCPMPRVAVRATYLLNPSRVTAFKAAFEATRQARGEVRVLLTGPWPPYSFVNRTETEGGAAPDDRFAELAQFLNNARRGRRG